MNMYKPLICASALYLAGCHGMRLKSVEEGIKYAVKPVAILLDTTTKVTEKLYQNMRETNPNIKPLSSDHLIDGVKPTKELEPN